MHALAVEFVTKSNSTSSFQFICDFFPWGGLAQASRPNYFRYARMFIQLDYHGTTIKLLGDAMPSSIICKPQLHRDISIDEVYSLFIFRVMETETQSQDPPMILPLAMQSLLDTIEFLFHKPTGIPLACNTDHYIVLQPRKGVCSRQTVPVPPFPKIWNLKTYFSNVSRWLDSPKL